MSGKRLKLQQYVSLLFTPNCAAIGHHPQSRPISPITDETAECCVECTLGWSRVYEATKSERVADAFVESLFVDYPDPSAGRTRRRTVPNPNENPVVWSAEYCEESRRLCAAANAATKTLDAAEEARALMKGDTGARREEQRARRRYDEANAALGEFLARMSETYPMSG